MPRTKAVVDEEISALAKTAGILQSLPEDAQRIRVIDYCYSRFGYVPPQARGEGALLPPDAPPAA